MTTEQLFSLKPNTTLLVKNDPFDYKGQAEITLEGKEIIYWFFGDEGNFISLNPSTEEIVFFQPTESELESDEEGAVFGGEPYELSYEDKGTVTKISEETAIDENDVINFTDYENDEGELVRVLENESTGESQIFTGRVLVEEEILAVED